MVLSALIVMGFAGCLVGDESRDSHHYGRYRSICRGPGELQGGAPGKPGNVQDLRLIPGDNYFPGRNELRAVVIREEKGAEASIDAVPA